MLHSVKHVENIHMISKIKSLWSPISITCYLLPGWNMVMTKDTWYSTICAESTKAKTLFIFKGLTPSPPL